MPFRSTAQQRYMFARHPEIARRWADEMKGAHRKGASKHPIKSANLPSHVDKGLMSRLLRRSSKDSAPIIRHGVTRASTVGVEIEHKGVKGWGQNIEAARMAWQQNASMAKNDIGKSDSWEVPMDHFEPALPRRRPNYGAGNTVGKRMTGAVTGVAQPKKVQATRVAPRRAAGMKLPTVQSMTTKPPIPPNMVGKSLRSKLLLPPKGKDAWQVRNAANRMENNSLGFDGGPGSRAVEDEMKRRRRVRQAGTISGSGVAAFAGARSGSHRKETAAKRDRSYNPEHSRQRRLGVATAATTIGGGGAIASGVREARRDTGTLRGIDPGVVHVPAEPSKPRKQTRGDSGRMRSLTPAEHEAEQKAYNERLGHRSRRLATREGLERARAAGEKGTVITRRSGGKLALGTALLGASGGMARYSRGRSNREYR